MNAAQLEAIVRALETQVKQLIKEGDESRRVQERIHDHLRALQSQADKTQQQLVDHIAHVEKWDARRWAVIGAIVGGLAINIVMLFLNRK